VDAAPRILLVDDEAPFRFSATVALRRSGFRVAEAPDGKEALSAILEARDAGDPFHLVVTDIRMPEMSGMELIDALALHRIRTPVCAITCYGDQDLVTELAAKGCAEYLEKPFSPDDLVQRIRAILGGDSG
jgi:DNA-binding response OmpR family regulator